MAFQSAHLTSLGIGIGISIAITILVRKNHLMASHAIWWLIVAAASMIFGAYPRLIDKIGAVLGIHYPPTLLIVIVMGFILIKMLTMDLKRTEQERKIRALIQRLAILESEIVLLVSSYRDSDSGDSLKIAEVSNHEIPAITHGKGEQDEILR
jgi:hypothetical protein